MGSNETGWTHEQVNKVKAEFQDTWPKLLNEIINELEFADIPECMDKLEQLMSINVPQGKHTRAYLNIFLYRALKPNRTKEEDFLNYVHGWEMEILQTAALIADDIMDKSETRRGMPCWHKQPQIGLSAVNDVFILEQIGHLITHKYFADKDYFLRLLELTHENNVRTVLGQSLDLKMASYEIPNFSLFNEATYKAQVKYKTSYYTFHRPAACALIRAGITDDICCDALEDLTLEIGELFQIQDDFLDCYGDPAITGKVGTDIRDGKMSWLIIKALKLASSSQLLDLQENYGKANEAAEQKVRSIYHDLGIKKLFYKHEDAMETEIHAKIRALPSALPQEPFIDVLYTLYRREK